MTTERSRSMSAYPVRLRVTAEDHYETRDWVDAQNRLTAAYVRASPQREEIRARLAELWNFPLYRAPLRRGDRYFFCHWQTAKQDVARP